MSQLIATRQVTSLLTLQSLFTSLLTLQRPLRPRSSQSPLQRPLHPRSSQSPLQRPLRPAGSVQHSSAPAGSVQISRAPPRVSATRAPPSVLKRPCLQSAPPRLWISPIIFFWGGHQPTGPWRPQIRQGRPSPRIYHDHLNSLPRSLRPYMLSLSLVSQFFLGPSLLPWVSAHPGGRLLRQLRTGGLRSRLLHPGGLLSRLLRPGGFRSRLLCPGGVSSAPPWWMH